MVENYEENPGTRKPETKSIIYIIKQDIRIYVVYSRPNGWIDWAENFCGHTGSVIGYKDF